MKKLKTKYNVLAKCKLESLSLSTALLGSVALIQIQYKNSQFKPSLSSQ
jgi:hypothetical protein